MFTDTDWTRMQQEHELAYFRADVCLGSPQSYTLDEKRRICEEMEASTAEIDAAMKRDFESLPPHAQAKMLDLLQQADSENFDWWLEVLVGKMPTSAIDLNIVDSVEYTNRHCSL